MKPVKCREVWDVLDEFIPSSYEQEWGVIDELLQETDFVNKAYTELARLHRVLNQEIIDMAKDDNNIPMYLRHEIAECLNDALIDVCYKLKKQGKVH